MVVTSPCQIGAVAPFRGDAAFRSVAKHQAQGQATQGRDLSTLAPLWALRACTPNRAWARRAVGEGVTSDRQAKPDGWVENDPELPIWVCPIIALVTERDGRKEEVCIMWTLVLFTIVVNTSVGGGTNTVVTLLDFSSEASCRGAAKSMAEKGVSTDQPTISYRIFGKCVQRTVRAR